MLRFINTRQALNSAGRLLEQKLKAQLKIDGTVATKKLYNSIGYSLSWGERSNDLYLWADKSMKYVDQGRKSGKEPPVSAILRWAEAKGIRPRDSKGKFTEDSRSNRFWMAKNIARSIGQKGTIKRFGGHGKGSDILNFVLNNNIESIKESVSAAFDADLNAHLANNIVDNNNGN